MSEHDGREVARQWLISGGGGHEDGEDGLRALTVSGEALVDFLAEYALSREQAARAQEWENVMGAKKSGFDEGAQQGIERAAQVVDQCNREGPYNAIGAAGRIRALQSDPLWLEKHDAEMRTEMRIATVRQLEKYAGDTGNVGCLEGDSEDPIYQAALKVHNTGFELAHELQPCGHSRGDKRDPDYIRGVSVVTHSVCIGCEREAQVAAKARQLETDWWHRRWHRDTGIPCDGSKEHCPLAS